MQKPNTPITKANFPSALRYAYRLNRKMRASILGQRIVLPLGSILFALSLFLLLLATVYAVAADKGGKLAIFERFPFVPEYITRIWALMDPITGNAYIKILILFGLLYLIPIVVCGGVRLVLPLFVKGQKPQLQGNDTQKAEQLCRYIEQGPFPKKDIQSTAWLWCKITGISAIVTLSVIVAQALFASLVSHQTVYWAYAVLGGIILLEIILLYITYAQLYFLLAHAIRPFCSADKEWKIFLREAEQYWYSLDPTARKSRETGSYDGWKFKNLGTSLYYQEKRKEHYARIMGLPYESDADRAAKIVRDTEEDLSGSGKYNY